MLTDKSIKNPRTRGNTRLRNNYPVIADESSTGTVYSHKNGPQRDSGQFNTYTLSNHGAAAVELPPVLIQHTETVRKPDRNLVKNDPEERSSNFGSSTHSVNTSETNSFFSCHEESEQVDVDSKSLLHVSSPTSFTDLNSNYKPLSACLYKFAPSQAVKDKTFLYDNYSLKSKADSNKKIDILVKEGNVKEKSQIFALQMGPKNYRGNLAKVGTTRKNMNEISEISNEKIRASQNRKNSKKKVIEMSDSELSKTENSGSKVQGNFNNSPDKEKGIKKETNNFLENKISKVNTKLEKDKDAIKVVEISDSELSETENSVSKLIDIFDRSPSKVEGKRNKTEIANSGISKTKGKFEKKSEKEKVKNTKVEPSDGELSDSELSDDEFSESESSISKLPYDSERTSNKVKGRRIKAEIANSEISKVHGKFEKKPDKKKDKNTVVEPSDSELSDSELSDNEFSESESSISKLQNDSERTSNKVKGRRIKAEIANSEISKVHGEFEKKPGKKKDKNTMVEPSDSELSDIEFSETESSISKLKSDSERTASKVQGKRNKAEMANSKISKVKEKFENGPEKEKVKNMVVELSDSEISISEFSETESSISKLKSDSERTASKVQGKRNKAEMANSKISKVKEKFENGPEKEKVKNMVVELSDSEISISEFSETESSISKLKSDSERTASKVQGKRNKAEMANSKISKVKEKFENGPEKEKVKNTVVELSDSEISISEFSETESSISKLKSDSERTASKVQGKRNKAEIANSKISKVKEKFENGPEKEKVKNMVVELSDSEISISEFSETESSISKLKSDSERTASKVQGKRNKAEMANSKISKVKEKFENGPEKEKVKNMVVELSDSEISISQFSETESSISKLKSDSERTASKVQGKRNKAEMANSKISKVKEKFENGPEKEKVKNMVVELTDSEISISEFSETESSISKLKSDSERTASKVQGKRNKAEMANSKISKVKENFENGPEKEKVKTMVVELSETESSTSKLNNSSEKTPSKVKGKRNQAEIAKSEISKVKGKFENGPEKEKVKNTVIQLSDSELADSKLSEAECSIRKLKNNNERTPSKVKRKTNKVEIASGEISKVKGKFENKPEKRKVTNTIVELSDSELSDWELSGIELSETESSISKLKNYSDRKLSKEKGKKNKTEIENSEISEVKGKVENKPEKEKVIKTVVDLSDSELSENESSSSLIKNNSERTHSEVKGKRNKDEIENGKISNIEGKTENKSEKEKVKKSYKRIISIGVNGISTYNPANLVSTNHWLYADIISVTPVSSPQGLEFQLTVKKGGKKVDTVKFASEHRAQIITEALKHRHMFSDKVSHLNVYNGYKMHWSDTKIPCVLEASPTGLERKDASTLKVMAGYYYKDIEAVYKMSDNPQGFIVSMKGADRLYMFSSDRKTEIISKMVELAASCVGLQLKVSDDLLSTDVYRYKRLGKFSNDKDQTSMVEFLVHKITPNSPEAVRKLLCITESCLIERDPSTYFVCTLRPLNLIFDLVRPLDNPQEFFIEYKDGDVRRYSTTERESILATLLDGVRASGNRDIHVRMTLMDRGKRIGPLYSPVDEEVESTHLRFLAQPPPGILFNEAVERFNASVSYSGLLHSVTQESFFAENKEKLINGALSAIVAREVDSETPIEELAEQFQALRRLVASKAGFAAFTSLQG
ncbi:hypothetical protein QYM36_014482, partial [Artemia franciscana]